MATRLASLSLELAASVDSAPSAVQGRVVRELMTWLFNEVPEVSVELRSAFLNDRPEVAEQIRYLADDEYLSLQENDAHADALQFFIRARAAAATVYAIRGEASEAIYEATVATDKLAEIQKIARDALNGVA